MKQITIATRKSRLAMWQTEHVAARLREAMPDLDVQLLPLSTRGDEILDRSLAEIGGKGLFLKELEVAQFEKRADIAVHSLKDVPAEQPDGLMLSAWLPRANPADLWITAEGTPIEQLPAGARIGSSSLRRISQLASRRSDLEVGPLRGNVETRLAAVREGRVDATILAAAGLERLGIVPDGAIALPVSEWLPAPGQGIVVVQQRSDEPEIAEALARLDCPMARAQAQAERAVVATLGGDCRMPLAAYAHLESDGIRLRARLGSEQGKLIDAERVGPVDQAEALGQQAAQELLENGGRELLKELGM